MKFRFYSTVERRSKKTGFAGGDSQGIRAHIRGWDMGVEVQIFQNEEGADEIVIRTTGGSNNPLPKETVYSLTDESGQEELVSPFQEIRIALPKKTKFVLEQNQ